MEHRTHHAASASDETAPTPLDRAIEGVSEGVSDLRDSAHDVLVEVIPRLRGWLHAATAPLTLAAGVVLIVLSPTPAARTGSAVFAASAVILFTASATMHRGRWSPRSTPS